MSNTKVFGKRVCDRTDDIVRKKLKTDDKIKFKFDKDLMKWLAKLDWLALEFRKYPICPAAQELAEDYDPAIQSNIIKGKYNDVEQYLDIQYRLLREDFVRPLRKSITEYKKAIRRVKKPLIPGVHIYHNVFIWKERINNFRNGYFTNFKLERSNLGVRQ